MEKDIFNKYKTFVMVGRPGSGKGMQTKLLMEKTGFKTFSTGDKLRELKKADTPLAHKIAATIDGGSLMPYWFASYLFQEAVIYLPKEEGIIYEGAGRKVREAELFNDVMVWLERPYLAIYLDVSDEVVTERLLKRGETSGREDDSSRETIQKRLDVYQHEIMPAIEVFKKHGVLLDVNGDQSAEKVFEEILQKISELE